MPPKLRSYIQTFWLNPPARAVLHSALSLAAQFSVFARFPGFQLLHRASIVQPVSTRQCMQEDIGANIQDNNVVTGHDHEIWMCLSLYLSVSRFDLFFSKQRPCLTYCPHHQPTIVITVWHALTSFIHLSNSYKQQTHTPRSLTLERHERRTKTGKTTKTAQPKENSLSALAGCTHLLEQCTVTRNAITCYTYETELEIHN